MHRDPEAFTALWTVAFLLGLILASPMAAQVESAAAAVDGMT